MRVRARRVLAVLAGGAVLVGGGVTTLASWQDTEFAQLPLSLSTFNIQTSLDGTTWTDAESAPSARTLVMAVSGVLSRSLTPNGATTAWVALRAAPKSLGATVTMTNIDLGTGANLDKGILGLTSGGSPALTYEAVSGIEKAACEANTFTGGRTIVNPGSSIAAVSTTQFEVPAGSGGAAGDAVGVCFRLKLADNIGHAYGGASITPLWTFNATSKE